MNRVAVRWSVDVELSFAQALYVVALGEQAVDPTVKTVLAQSVQTINDRLLTQSLDLASFWETLRSSAQCGSTVLASIPDSLDSAGCSELMIENAQRQVATLLADSRQDLEEALPQLAAQIELRYRPLRDRWETCGFGLLRTLAKGFWGGNYAAEPDATDPIPLVMIQPIRGGDGGVDAGAGRVWMEAMLTDVDPEVPEVLRLAFLAHLLLVMRALNFDHLSQEMRRAYRLAIMVQCLDVGGEFDLIRSGDLPISRAMDLWRIGDASEVDTVACWWKDTGRADDPWPIKVQRLSNELAIA